MGTRPADEMRQKQRADGPASILAIGTANPKHYILQADYPNYYFRLTRNEHMTELKEKFTRICEKSMIRKRHFILTEEILKENSSSGICTFDAPTLNFRQGFIMEQIPKLGAEAAVKAIEEWGQPKSKITHLVFCTTVPAEMPGADYRLIKLLGLNSSVKRVVLYFQGCFAGGSVLRVAKDIAENNADARVLIVCCESTVVMFRGPSEESTASLIGEAIFSDGASSVIIGSDPKEAVEHPIFQIMFTAETILPDSDGTLSGKLLEAGLTSFNLSERLPYLIANNIEKSLVEALDPLGINDWNSIFWAPHPGGPKILDEIESKLALKKDKFRAARHVLAEYGNMSSSGVLFILDEIRRKSAEEKMATTGKGLEWGILFGIGPGLTIETVVLHSVAIA